MYEDVIGSDAGLSCIKKFAEDDAARSSLEICGLIDDAWTLAAKL